MRRRLSDACGVNAVTKRHAIIAFTPRFAHPKAGTKGGSYSGAAEVAPGVWVYQFSKNGVAVGMDRRNRLRRCRVALHRMAGAAVVDSRRHAAGMDGRHRRARFRACGFVPDRLAQAQRTPRPLLNGADGNKPLQEAGAQR